MEYIYCDTRQFTRLLFGIQGAVFCQMPYVFLTQPVYQSGIHLKDEALKFNNKGECNKQNVQLKYLMAL